MRACVHRQLRKCFRVPVNLIPSQRFPAVGVVIENVRCDVGLVSVPFVMRLPFIAGWSRCIDEEAELRVDEPFGRLVLIERCPCRFVVDTSALHILCRDDTHCRQ